MSDQILLQPGLGGWPWLVRTYVCKVAVRSSGLALHSPSGNTGHVRKKKGAVASKIPSPGLGNMVDPAM